MKLRILTGFLIGSVLNFSCKVAEKDNSVTEGKIVQKKKAYDLIVAKDGSGKYTTVQEAVDAVPR